MDNLRPRWSSRTKITIALLILGLFVYLLYRFSVVLAPMALALILAYILSPVVNFIQMRMHLKRALAIFFVYLLLIALIAILPLVIIQPLATQFTELNLDIQRTLASIEELLGNQYVIAGQVIDVDSVVQQFTGSLQGVLESLFGQTLGFAVDIIESLVWLIFIFVVSFYLIKDGEALRAWLENIVPPAYRKDYIKLRNEISLIWSAFFRGQLVLATVVTAIFLAAGFILGLPFTLAMAIFAGLMEFLPSVGHAIWLFFASVIAFFLGSTWIPLPNWAFMLLVIGLHLFFEQFDLNYLIPRIIGRRVHLPPPVVILGIVTGAVLAGVLGILLAAPTISSARVVGRYFYANLFDMEPFPVSVAPPLPAPDSRWWEKAFRSLSSRLKRTGKL